MRNRGTVFITLILVIGLLFAVSAWAATNPKAHRADREMPLRLPYSGNGHLDQNDIHYRYNKTTDYGVTWSGIMQAGDLSDLEGWNGEMYDFGSICDNDNNLHFMGVLNAFTNAADNGVYDVHTTNGGTSWVRSLIAAEGTNTFTSASEAKDAAGNLYCLIWGTDANENSTFWGTKSTDHGMTWSTLMVLAAAPGNMDASASYPHLAENASATYCFFQFQEAVTDYEQYVGRFPTDMSAGATIVSLNDYSGSEVSYYIGACAPIAYDPTNNALFCCFRNGDLTATAVYYSDDAGATFDAGSDIAGAQRYPSVALNSASMIPYVFSNVGVPASGTYHHDWFAYDDGGYGGGLWTDQIQLDSVYLDTTGARDLLYVHQGYFFDANHVISMCNVWGDFTPEGVLVNYSNDGGATWAGGWKLWDIFADGLRGDYIEQCQLDGGSNGVAYITFCAAYGETDQEGPVIDMQTLVTPPTELGPYVVSARFTDATWVDYEGWIWVNWICYSHGAEWNYAEQDSHSWTDPETASGTYYFTIPDTHADGAQIADGDTIYFYCDGYDFGGNYSAHWEQWVRAGHEWATIDNQPSVTPEAFTLYGNYPNPFNPTTTIQFDLANRARIELKVFNVLGQEVATLLDGVHSAGAYSIPFDASDLPSGVYIYTLSAKGFSESRKMVLLK
ncbi:T9SS type A sorting domain-containing protein [bacterium]|nr:T9SS type A sorting domain-containing protein [bacterium]